MSHDRDHQPTSTATDATGSAEAETPARQPLAVLDFVIGGGSATAIATAIAARAPEERDPLMARVHELRGNRFAVEVEAALLREADRDPVAPVGDGTFDLSLAESLLITPSLDSSRKVIEMIGPLPPDQLGAALAAFERDGLLQGFLRPLPFAYVAALAQRVPHGSGHSHVLSLMRPYYEGHDTTDHTVTGMLDDIPGVGGALAFGFEGLTFGYAHEHDAAYRDKVHGLVTEDEYVDRSNRAAAKAGTIAVGTMGFAAAGAGVVEGMTTGMAAGGTAGRVGATTLVGGAGGAGGGFGAQVASDLYEGHLSSPEDYGRSIGTGAGLGLAGGAVGGAVGETMRALPPGMQARLTALLQRFPNEGELFAQFRELGQQHAVRIKAGRLDQLLGDGTATWASPDLAMATAGLAPDTPLTVTGELTDHGLTVLHAEKLPDADALGESLAKAPEGPRPDVGAETRVSPEESTAATSPAPSSSVHREPFTTPNGEQIEIATDGMAIVPTKKVEAYARGKSEFSPELAKEYEQLKVMKQTKRKEYDRNPANEARLDTLARLRKNSIRSAEMAETLDGAGFPDSPEGNHALLEHLVAVGKNITNDNRLDYRSELAGATGRVKILSTWKIIDGGRPYLSTLKLIPMEP